MFEIASFDYCGHKRAVLAFPMHFNLSKGVDLKIKHQWLRTTKWFEVKCMECVFELHIFFMVALRMSMCVCVGATVIDFHYSLCFINACMQMCCHISVASFLN